ncbi:MAG: DUF3352 domain-containing protein [Armatimonadota bacterium]
MEEIPTTQQAKNSTKTVPIIILILLIAIAIAGSIFIINKFKKEPYNPIAFVPKDVITSIVFDFSPSSEKSYALEYLDSIFKESKLSEENNQIDKKMEEMLGINFTKDILPKLNGMGSFCVLSKLNGFQPNVAINIGIKKAQEADQIMTLIGNKLNDRNANFEENEYEKFHYYSIMFDYEVMHIGALNNSILISNSDMGFKAVIDTIKKGDNLGKNAEYAKYSSDNKSTVATMYFSGEKLTEMIEPVLNSFPLMEQANDINFALSKIKNLKEAFAVVKTTDKGFVIKNDFIMADGVVLNASKKKLEDFAKIAPEDAAVMLSFSSLSELWKTFDNEMAKNPNLKKEIYGNEMVSALKQILGVDIIDNGLKRIDFLGIYLTLDPQRENTQMPGYAVAVIKPDKPAVMKETLNTLKFAISMSGMAQMTTDKIYNYNANVFRFTEQPLSIALVEVDDYILIAASQLDIKEYLKKAVSAPAGKSGTLVNTKRFAQFKQMLPSDAEAVFFLSSESIVDALSANIPAEEKADAKLLAKKLGTMAITGVSSDKNKYTYTTVIPYQE